MFSFNFKRGWVGQGCGRVGRGGVGRRRADVWVLGVWRVGFGGKFLKDAIFSIRWSFK